MRGSERRLPEQLRSASPWRRSGRRLVRSGTQVAVARVQPACPALYPVTSMPTSVAILAWAGSIAAVLVDVIARAGACTVSESWMTSPRSAGSNSRRSSPMRSGGRD